MVFIYFSLDAIPWIPSSSGTNLSFGYMETSLDLRHRSDTGKSNNSPYVSLQPFIGYVYMYVLSLFIYGIYIYGLKLGFETIDM